MISKSAESTGGTEEMSFRVIRVVKRRLRWPYYGFTKRLFLLALTTWSLLALAAIRHLSKVTSSALLPPTPAQLNLQHFARSRSLQHYLYNIKLLVEPSSPHCSPLTPVLALVASAPSRWRQRDAIRATWGARLPTFFLTGLAGEHSQEKTPDMYFEAKRSRDMIIYDFLDHYQNLTLKTALMLQWASTRCARVRFLLKADDDVLINPWMLDEVVKGNSDAQLIGWMQNNTLVFRDEHNKWYIPRWLIQEDVIPRYLMGAGYLIQGALMKNLLQTAYKVPLYNIEDMYFTYSVAYKTLQYNLVHDRRLSSFRTWVSWIGCSFFSKALVHSMTPKDMVKFWREVERIGSMYERDATVCDFYERYLDEIVIWLLRNLNA